jgi:hypothetical protein
MRSLLAVLPVLVVSIRAGSSEEPRFAVEAKSRLEKSFESGFKLESTAYRLSIEGVEEPVTEEPDVKISIESTSRVDVTDEYVEMGKGRPAKLKRTFDKIEDKDRQTAREAGEGGEDGADGDGERTKGSALEGKSVLFSWSDESKGFVPSFASGEGEADLLEGLTEDMDLRFLLPKGKVSEGDSWDLEPIDFGSVLDPGGDLKVKEKDAKEDEENGNLGREIRKHLDGKARAKWKGVREEDGRKLGIAAITADLSSEGDAEAKGEEGAKTHFQIRFALEGELAWDLAAGHFRAFELKGKVEMKTASTMSIEVDGEKAVMKQDVELEGETSFHASVR